MAVRHLVEMTREETSHVGTHHQHVVFVKVLADRLARKIYARETTGGPLR